MSTLSDVAARHEKATLREPHDPECMWHVTSACECGVAEERVIRRSASLADVPELLSDLRTARDLIQEMLNRVGASRCPYCKGWAGTSDHNCHLTALLNRIKP